MSEKTSKTRFNSIIIKVPDEMISISKTGKMLIKPTLTKGGNPTKLGNKQSVQLEGARVSSPVIVNRGQKLTEEQAKQSAKTEKDFYKASGQKDKDLVLKKTKTFKKKLDYLIADEDKAIKQKQKRLAEVDPKLFPVTAKAQVVKSIKARNPTVNTPAPKKSNKWIEHVKSIATAYNLSYKEAMKRASQERKSQKA